MEAYPNPECKMIVDIHSHKKQKKIVLIGNFDKLFNETISKLIRKDFSKNYRIKTMAMSTPWSDNLIDIIKNNPVDVLILFLNNIGFRGDNGQVNVDKSIELIGEIKEKYGVPIISLISNSFTLEGSPLFKPNILEMATGSGVDFFFPAPCKWKVLKNAIGECLNRKTMPPKIVPEPSFAEIIKKTMSIRFSNGFRINSPIELRRFRRFVTEDFGDEILITDEELTKSITSSGTLFDGKVYIISNEIENRIQKQVDLVVSSGTEIIFYSSFYSQHEEWLFHGSVISEKMLKDILVTLYPKYMHKRNYFSPKVGNYTEHTKIKREIMHFWGSNVTLNYEQLSERLPYIPIDKIKSVLTQNSDFIWNATEVYTHVAKVDLSDEEITIIKNYVAVACQKDGYASLNDIPLEEISERNYELTITAIHNAVFSIILADNYEKRGKIITRKGDTLDARTIIKEHCRTLDKCSLQDLLDLERELTGESHRWIPMEAGYAVMVRTDEYRYVSEKHVYFNTEKIDHALDRYMTGDYLPLKSVNTFATFPDCGQVWNLFLLESYCRRFSNRFRFEVLAVNSKNAGAVVRKSCRLSYLEIMADAVANSKTPLEKTVIEEFLCNNGYIGRRSYARTSELIEQAKAIRERRK